ncbi:hypothetical protein F5Y19DRAFT_478620 [Xylariaceae sp. FL1651]|nr:hypothetical protein F5Y19DRAFT_478620 [Xylariaceae sp. FL1651]
MMGRPSRQADAVWLTVYCTLACNTDLHPLIRYPLASLAAPSFSIDAELTSMRSERPHYAFQFPDQMLRPRATLIMQAYEEAHIEQLSSSPLVIPWTFEIGLTPECDRHLVGRICDDDDDALKPSIRTWLAERALQFAFAKGVVTSFERRARLMPLRGGDQLLQNKFETGNASNPQDNGQVADPETQH